MANIYNVSGKHGYQLVEHRNNSILPNLEPILAAGINPKTGLPYKMGSASYDLKSEIKKDLRIKDEQTAVNRYVWGNLPDNFELTSQEIERLIYYKGQLAFFYMPEIDKYLLLPYALDGTIDAYGRYNHIHPVPMTSGDDEDKNRKSPIATLLASKRLKCIYKNIGEEPAEQCCVLLYDYTKQLSQTNIARVVLNDALLDVMAEMIPYARTSAILGTGIQGLRVQDADQADAVLDAAKSLERAALSGIPWAAIVGQMEFQELAPGQLAKVEEYYLSMQSLDNFRLSLYGLGEGVYEKKAHTLESEQEMNMGPNELVMEDGLQIRKHFTEMVNKLFGLSITVKKAELTENEVMNEEEDSEGETEDVTNDSTI